MDKRDSESLRVFDGNKFPVWKFYMELCFSTKEVMHIVDGTTPQPGEDASEIEKAAWQKSDNLAKQLIGASVTTSSREPRQLYYCNFYVVYVVCILPTEVKREYLHGTE